MPLESIYVIILSDEDLIAEETKMHKNIYFPMNKGRMNRNRGAPAISGSNSRSEGAQKEKKPVNFLFSNEDDADDDSGEE